MWAGITDECDGALSACERHVGEYLQYRPRIWDKGGERSSDGRPLADDTGMGILCLYKIEQRGNNWEPLETMAGESLHKQIAVLLARSEHLQRLARQAQDEADEIARQLAKLLDRQRQRKRPAPSN
jgi:hypothetical protein